MSTKRENTRKFATIASCTLAPALLALSGGTTPVALAAPQDDPYASYRTRTSVPLPVTARDFTTSHPDFAGAYASAGKGRYGKITADTLDVDGKPVFSSTGFKITSDRRDSAGRAIIAARSYINSAPGDVAGSMSTSPGGAVTTAPSFGQWFRTVPGVNTKYRSSMALNWTGTSYVFDGSLDAFAGHNDFDYTAAIDTTFIHESAKNAYINVATGAEVFIFIDGKLVIDGGGGLGNDSSDAGLAGGHFDVDVYSSATDKEQYHKHEYDDAFDVTWVDIAKDSRLLFSSILGSNPNPLRVQFINKDNGGWGVFSFSDGSSQAAGWVSAGLDRVFRAADLQQFRVDFRSLALMAHTSPGTSQSDVANRAGAFSVRITDTVTNKLVYELAVYHHGSAPDNYQAMRDAYQAHQNTELQGRGMPNMGQRIDLSRLPWLQDGETHRLQVFFANRTGAPSQFRFETNINTLDLVALPSDGQRD